MLVHNFYSITTVFLLLLPTDQQHSRCPLDWKHSQLSSTVERASPARPPWQQAYRGHAVSAQGEVEGWRRQAAGGGGGVQKKTNDAGSSSGSSSITTFKSPSHTIAHPSWLKPSWFKPRDQPKASAKILSILKRSTIETYLGWTQSMH